jgi:hypothetical protein
MASHGKIARAASTVHRLTCERLDTRDADLSRWVEIGLSAPVSRRSAMRQLIAAARFAQPTAPACPTLIVSSDADRLVIRPVRRAWPRRGAACRTARHPWAGHDLPHDDAQWLCDTVSRFDAQRKTPDDVSHPAFAMFCVLSVRGDSAQAAQAAWDSSNAFALVAQRAEQRFGRRFQAFLRAEQPRGISPLCSDP